MKNEDKPLDNEFNNNDNDDDNEIVQQSYLPTKAVYVPKPGEPGFKEDPPVVYDEEEIFRRPARKIIIRK